jgi:hypothetical protein
MNKSKKFDSIDLDHPRNSVVLTRTIFYLLVSVATILALILASIGFTRSVVIGQSGEQGFKG